MTCEIPSEMLETLDMAKKRDVFDRLSRRGEMTMKDFDWEMLLSFFTLHL